MEQVNIEESYPQPTKGYGECDYINIVTGIKCDEVARISLTINDKEERKCLSHFNLTRNTRGSN